MRRAASEADPAGPKPDTVGGRAAAVPRTAVSPSSHDGGRVLGSLTEAGVAGRASVSSTKPPWLSGPALGDDDAVDDAAAPDGRRGRDNGAPEGPKRAASDEALPPARGRPAAAPAADTAEGALASGADAGKAEEGTMAAARAARLARGCPLPSHCTGRVFDPAWDAASAAASASALASLSLASTADCACAARLTQDSLASPSTDAWNVASPASCCRADASVASMAARRPSVVERSSRRVVAGPRPSASKTALSPGCRADDSRAA